MKRVAQELGGKSANIVLDDADLASVIARDVASLCNNSGQSCNAPSRMLVPAARMDEAAAIAAEAASTLVVGDPADADTQLGPVVSEVQYDRIQRLSKRASPKGQPSSPAARASPTVWTPGTTCGRRSSLTSATT